MRNMKMIKKNSTSLYDIRMYKIQLSSSRAGQRDDDAGYDDALTGARRETRFLSHAGFTSESPASIDIACVLLPVEMCCGSTRLRLMLRRG